MIGRSRLRPWAGALVIVFALAGCAGLPSSSGVMARQPITDAPYLPPANVEFYGPQDGAGPVEIVKGFLRANGGTDEDFAVAREFLTNSASQKWAPSGRVEINQGERDFSLSVVSPNHIRLTATQSAELDSDGHLKLSPAPTRRTFDIFLTKVDGQWRISGLPADFGPYLSISDFRDRAYAPYVVYLAERRTKTLVPDQQWFPRTGITTALARAVLRGSPGWLASSQGSAPDLNQLPAGTRLAVDAVPISADGVATVDLTGAVRQADPASRTALWAAMMATLNQVPTVHRVSLTVAGTRLDTTNLPSAPVTPADVGYTVAGSVDNGVITRVGQTLHWSSDNWSGQVPSDSKQPRLPALTRNWYLLAGNGAGTQVAAISGDRASLGRWVGGSAEPFVVPIFGRQLTRPSFDFLDELWLAGLALSNAGPDREASSGASVWVMDATTPVTTARPQAVSAPWLGTDQVLSLKVAIDGQRVAMVTRAQDGSTKLLVSFVIRDANGQATALARPVQVGQPVSSVTDVGWLDDVTLGAIGVIAGSGAPQVVEVPLSGFVNPLGAVPGASALITTGRGTGDLFVVTNTPGVLERIGGGWRTVPGASDVLAPGS